jgi:hypothetical protein
VTEKLKQTPPESTCASALIYLGVPCCVYILNVCAKENLVKHYFKSWFDLEFIFMACSVLPVQTGMTGSVLIVKKFVKF